MMPKYFVLMTNAEIIALCVEIISVFANKNIRGAKNRKRDRK